MVNLKQLITDLSGMAYNHPQVNSFGFGTLDQLTSDIETKKEPKYTRMYVIPGDVTLNQNEITYTLSVIIADRIEDNLSNQKDVMSDTLEIAKDIFTIIYRSYSAPQGGFTLDYEPAWGSLVSPFLERFETILGGWTLNLTINQPFDYNRCVLPELAFTNTTWSELAELWDKVNEDWDKV
jgi:hypothetical protein